MWQDILRSQPENRRRKRWLRLAAAAVALLFLAAGTVDYLKDSSTSQTEQLELLSVSDDNGVMLQVGSMEYALGGNCRIACSTKKGIVCVSMGANVMTIPYAEGDDIKVATGNNRRKTLVTLPDGSRVTLRRQSRLVFPWKSNTADARRETWLSGEALLHVAHNARRPFVVHTRNIAVRVIGTVFDIREYYGSTTSDVTLLKGLVAVSTPQGKDITMSPGQRLTVDTRAKSIRRTRLTHADEVADWTREIIRADHMPLDRFLAIVADVYQHHLEYDRDEARQISVSGKFDTSVSIEEFVNRLHHISTIKITVTEKANDKK